MITKDARCTREIKSRTAMAKPAFSKKKSSFNSKLELNLRKEPVKSIYRGSKCCDICLPLQNLIAKNCCTLWRSILVLCCHLAQVSRFFFISFILHQKISFPFYTLPTMCPASCCKFHLNREKGENEGAFCEISGSHSSADDNSSLPNERRFHSYIISGVSEERGASETLRSILPVDAA